jgi:serine/threonine protein kinase
VKSSKVRPRLTPPHSTKKQKPKTLTPKNHTAVEVESGEPCALKIIVRSNLNPNLLASLRNESTITSSFGIQPHVNLCVPIKVHETRSKIVVEMDLVEGGDLMDFLTQTPSLKWLDQMQPLRLLPQIFRGVEYLHRNRVIHGDLKPENILLTRRPGMKLRPGDSLAAAPGCMYKICDFGNSVVVPEEAEVVTLGGKKVGTPGYASPEAWNGEAIGFESDMWSLGILVYVIFTGELPYEPTDEVSCTSSQSSHLNPTHPSHPPNHAKSLHYGRKLRPRFMPTPRSRSNSFQNGSE